MPDIVHRDENSFAIAFKKFIDSTCKIIAKDPMFDNILFLLHCFAESFGFGVIQRLSAKLEICVTFSCSYRFTYQLASSLCLWM